MRQSLDFLYANYYRWGLSAHFAGYKWMPCKGQINNAGQRPGSTDRRKDNMPCKGVIDTV